MKKEKVFFIYPPFFDEDVKVDIIKKSDIAYLRGYLESKKVTTELIDINAMVYLDADFAFAADNLLLEMKKRLRSSGLLVDDGNFISQFKKAQALLFNNFSFYEIWDFFLKRQYFNNCFKKINFSQKSTIHLAINYASQLWFALILALFIKKQSNNDIKIALSGVVVSSNHQELLYLFNKNKVIDYFIIGEGESALFKIATHSESEVVPNVIYLEKNDYKYSLNIGHEEDINSLSPPIYELQDVKILRFSRHCYWNKCNYCIFDKHRFYSGFQQRSPEKVINDIDNINRRLGLANEKIIFRDNCLTYSFFHNFANLLLKKHWENKNRFEAFFRCEPWLNYDILKLAKKANFSVIKIGVETMNNRLREMLNKGIKDSNIFKIIQNCHRLNISILVHFMIGLPTQTKKELTEDLFFMKDLIDKYSNLMICVKPLRVEKGSYIYQNPTKFNINLDEDKRGFAEDTTPFTQKKHNAISILEANQITRNFYNKHFSGSSIDNYRIKFYI